MKTRRIVESLPERALWLLLALVLAGVLFALVYFGWFYQGGSL